MNLSSEKVLKYLGGHENIEHISVQDLQILAEESPYFPVAQFLLAKKLQSNNHDNFLPQVQKTALYFSNTYWLHYQLSNDLWQNNSFKKENFSGKKIENTEDFVEENSKEEKESDLITEQLLINNYEGKVEKPEETNELLKNIVDKEENESIATNHLKFNEKEKEENAENVSQPEEEMAAITRDTDFLAEDFLKEAEAENEIYSDNYNELPPLETEPTTNAETIEVLEEMAGVSHGADETTEVFLGEADTAEQNDEQFLQTEISSPTSDISAQDENIQTVVPDEHEQMFQNIKAMLDATSEEADADVENTTIPIDPYYTVDYFASQGIKLEFEPNPKDQLGQHLKKFTHWLKHMKKLGPEDAVEVITRTGTEADIQKNAETSNTVREVVTEAMAAVLEKQGKKDKAIELYKKLSFINPSKSAYFAGKITNLKGK